MVQTETRRLQRLAEELEESGLPADGSAAFRSMLLEEVDHALRPTVHERRVASSGTILEPKPDLATWTEGTELQISRTPLHQPTVALWGWPRGDGRCARSPEVMTGWSH